MTGGRAMHARNYDEANVCSREGTYPSSQQDRERYMHNFQMQLAGILDRRRVVGTGLDGTEEQQMVEACQSKTSIVPLSRRCKHRFHRPGIQVERGLSANWRPIHVHCSIVRALRHFLRYDQGTQATVLMDKGGRRTLCRDSP